MLPIMLFGFLALIFLLTVNFLGSILREKKPNFAKNQAYECGEESVGNTWKSFNPRFYLIALIFVLFEAEIIFLFPWTVVFSDKEIAKTMGASWTWLVFFEVICFIGIMIAGLAYVWVKGYLDWDIAKAKSTEFVSPVPQNLYEKFNAQVESKNLRNQ
jgi:NADH-quinone oxidoreductase subunit A